MHTVVFALHCVCALLSVSVYALQSTSAAAAAAAEAEAEAAAAAASVLCRNTVQINNGRCCCALHGWSCAEKHTVQLRKCAVITQIKTQTEQAQAHCIRLSYQSIAAQ